MKYYVTPVPFQPAGLHPRSVPSGNLFLVIVWDRMSPEILRFLFRCVPIEFDIGCQVFFATQSQVLENALRISKYLRFSNALKFVFCLKDSYSIKLKFVFDFVINETNCLLFMGKCTLVKYSRGNLENYLSVIEHENFQIGLNLKNSSLHKILLLEEFFVIILKLLAPVL